MKDFAKKLKELEELIKCADTQEELEELYNQIDRLYNEYNY